MVEDGHLTNAYQYDSSPPNYFDALNNKNDRRNNNDTCISVDEADRRDRGDAIDANFVDRVVRATTGKGGSVMDRVGDVACQVAATDDTTRSNAATTAFAMSPLNVPVSNSITKSNHVDRTSVAVPLCRPTETRITTMAASETNFLKNNAAVPIFDKTYSSESNGSSHVDQRSAASQNLFDVTKDPEIGGGNGGDPPPEIHKTVIAFGILIFNFFLTTTSLAIIHDKVPDYGPLPDVILEVFNPPFNFALTVSEILIIVNTAIMLIIVALHRHRFVIFRRLFLMLSLLYFMRSVTMFVTVLPVSSDSYRCSPKIKDPSVMVILGRSFQLFFGMGLTINGQHTYCGDYVYSGHTTILVMCYLMISEYGPRRTWWLRWASWCMSLTGVLMVLASHSHYTVDVIIGYFVTTRLFWMYHTCANNSALKKRTRYNYVAREWWFKLFQYFERNVKEPLQPLDCITFPRR